MHGILKFEMPSTIIVILVIMINLTPLSSEIIKNTLKFDARSYVKFGSVDGEGFISISIGNANIIPSSSSSPPINRSKVGVFFAPTLASSKTMHDAEKNNTCILNDSNVSPLMTFDQLSSPPNVSMERTVEIKESKSYTIFFHNCEKKTLVNLNASLDTYDHASKAHRDYVEKLSMFLPKVMVVESVSYVVFLAFWAGLCYTKRQYVHKIHLMMGCLLALGLLKSLCGIPTKHPISKSNFIFFLVSLIINMAYYVSVIAIMYEAGDKLIKPCLKENEKISLVVFFDFQIFINFGYMMLRFSEPWHMMEEQPDRQNLDFWDYIYLAGDQAAAVSISILLVLVMHRMKKDQNEEGYILPKKLKRLKIMVWVYFVFLVYQIVAKTGMLVFRIFHEYDVWWMTVVIKQVALFLVYLFVICVFLPLSWHEHTIWGNQPMPAQVHPHDQI